MPKFAAHTFVHDGLTSHSFAPGDEVPEWALEQVGDHVLVPEEKAESEDPGTPADSGAQDQDPGTGDENDPDGDKDDDSDGEDSTPPPADDQPDFTAPAPARRGRTRKQ
ncbi:hypothetical protein [Pseudarthrobacter sp. NIBRBAC000502770]|uniref:hypothetical protein n=1 Tax=Pseudarthrobacter sp. NIBRBAC000502770 TaxID=2590785 RepID=UPI0011403B18|nr:hypothetical protein [Pseudarthrobacter sp. NIBRBAC000502770]QDG90708.1 hypothetical protein NIBR502770_21020 [Pseudarthrobacter sp. NIBRBAC000502770]